VVNDGVTYELRGRVAWVTLDRPGDRNRLTHAAAAGLIDACEEAEDGQAVVVVLRGRGDWFCGGLADGVAREELGGRRNPVDAVARITKPVVVVLTGPAAGAGAELALAGDLRLAADGATLTFPDVGDGRVPCFGATQRLPRLIGRTRALEVLLLAAPISAPAAAAMGLVSRVAPAADIDQLVDEVVGGLCAQGPLALAMAKEAVLRAGDLPLADGMRLEEDLYVLLQTTTDRAEGVRSFLEKRRPRFRGE
jgi:enoyl-CoA hydratase/carnithine racemase